MWDIYFLISGGYKGDQSILLHWLFFQLLEFNVANRLLCRILACPGLLQWQSGTSGGSLPLTPTLAMNITRSFPPPCLCSCLSLPRMKLPLSTLQSPLKITSLMKLSGCKYSLWIPIAIYLYLLITHHFLHCIKIHYAYVVQPSHKLKLSSWDYYVYLKKYFNVYQSTKHTVGDFNKCC